MVFPQNADLAVLVANCPAVQEQRELCRKSDADSDNRGQVEVVCLGARVLGKRAYGLDDDDDGDGDHERAEGEVARGFDACLAAGEFTRVDAGDGAVAHDECEVRQWVEERVGHGGEERERLGAYGRVELEDGENDVGGEGAYDGDFVLEVVGIVLLFRCASVIVHGLEKPFDVLILCLVELLQFTRIARLFVQTDGSTAISFPRGVGANERKFTLMLDCC